MTTTSLSPNNEIIGSEHYIHSRLRSTLPCGPKEVAGAYTGIGTTANVRRMASLNAEARTKLVYTPDGNSSTGLKSPTRNRGLVSPSKSDTNGMMNHHHTAHTNGVTSGQNILTPNKHTPHNEGPLSACLARESPTDKHTLVSTSPKKYVIKDSFVELKDIMKTPPKEKYHSNPSKSPVLRSTTSGGKSSGYIKRIAAANAEAFVHAIIGYEHPTNHHPSPLLPKTRPATTVNQCMIHSTTHINGLSVLGKRPQSSRQTAGNSNHNNSKKKKETDATNRDNAPIAYTTVKGTSGNVPYKIVPLESLHLELASSSNEEDETPSPDPRDGTTQFSHLEPVAYNCLGLLYNSDTVHSKTVIYLTTEGRLPSVVIPPIIPQKLREVNLAKENVHSVKRRSRKGDNGWIAIGQSIKTIKIKSRDGGEHVERKYFIGIKRKDEELFVRDSIVVRSGKKSENPYVAKIGSIWQEKEGLVVTAFWYYRPEDVSQIISSQFYPNEVMASQHHDDIGVACIDDKCQVYGYTQYYRYRANLEATKANVLRTVNIVPPIDTEIEGVSFSATTESLQSKDNYSSASKKVKADTDDTTDRNVVDRHDDVYFCYRAFNHITGKIIKHSVN